MKKSKKKSKKNHTYELNWDDLSTIKPICLELGESLSHIVDESSTVPFYNLRKKLSEELGFLIPAVCVKKNLDLAPNEYVILIKNICAGIGEIYPKNNLAINPGLDLDDLEGIKVFEPSYELDAIWIEPSHKEKAQQMGYTVVSTDIVLATHLKKLLQSYSHLLLGYDEVKTLLDRLAHDSPVLVHNLVSEFVSIRIIFRVLRSLLFESIPIRDFKTIVEALVDASDKPLDSQEMVSLVRIALGSFIVQHIAGNKNELSVITLAPELEEFLVEESIPPNVAERLINALKESTENQRQNGTAGILLVSAPIRFYLMRFVKHTIPFLHVLSYSEVPQYMQLKIVSVVSVPISDE